MPIYQNFMKSVPNPDASTAGRLLDLRFYLFIFVTPVVKLKNIILIYNKTIFEKLNFLTLLQGFENKNAKSEVKE